jgi:hypothetical protein
MYRIIEGRGTGKTRRLMEEAKKCQGTIVCYNPKAMEEKAKAYGIVGVTFIGYTEFLGGRGREAGTFFIDEMEGFSRAAVAYSGVLGNFGGYTLSLE